MKAIILLLAVIATTRANTVNPIGDIFAFADLTKKTAELVQNLTQIKALPPPQNAPSVDSLKVPRKTVIELVQDEGYPVESHYVTTQDGYILNMYRIPHGVTGKKLDKVVFLQHGLMAACTDWILFGKNRGLAYILADEGYDVWLANCRGNYYSRNHTKWNPDKDAEFWDYTWNEIGQYDIPAMIDYVLEKTGKQKLYHIGHSQGTTSFYVMASMRPEYNSKIQHHISLAPIAFMKHLKSPVMQILSTGTLPMGTLFQLLGQHEFLPEASFLNLIADVACSAVDIGKVLCKNALFAVAGFNEKQMKTEDVPLVMTYYPAGASTKQMMHYGQEITSGKFCRFDLGLLKNNKEYGRLLPPDYDLNKITAKITLIYSENDWLSSPVDVTRLYNSLKNVVEMYKVRDTNWNHVDYLFGKDVATVLYPKVIDVLAKN